MKGENLILLVVLSLLACLNCFLTFAIFTIVVMATNVSKYTLRLWGWFGIVFISLLCMTKTPVTDLEWIVDQFHMAGQMNYSKFIMLLGKEPVYQTFSYIMHFILRDNEKLFVFTLSFVTLSLLYIAFFQFAEKIRINQPSYILCVFLILFFPFFFGMPVHLVRQTMSMSLFVFVFVNKICYKRFYWPLAILVPFIHSTSLFCIPFLFFGFMKSPIGKRTFIFYLVIVAVIFSIQQLSSSLLPLFKGNELLSYAFERASQDTTFDSRVVIYQIVITALLGIGLFLITHSKHIEKRSNSEIIYFSNFIIILVLFILAATGQAELQARYNTVIFQYMAFIICLYLKRIKIMGSLLNVVSIILFFVWWYYDIYITPFEFKGIENFYFYTIFDYYNS